MNRTSGVSAFLLLMTLANATAQTSPITVTGVVHNQLSTPTVPPTVQVVGTCTGTNYQYEYVAIDAANGMTGPSPANTAVSGCSSFSTSNFNIVTTSPINGASICGIWRTAPTTGK